jgi:hypothetical protein
MARPRRVQVSRGRYDLTARGNGRQPIFADDSDHGCFLGVLAAGGAAGLLAARFGLGARPRREGGDGSQGTPGAG